MRIEIYDNGDSDVGIPSFEATIEIMADWKYTTDDVSVIKDFFKEFFDIPRADIVVFSDDIIDTNINVITNR